MDGLARLQDLDRTYTDQTFYDLMNREKPVLISDCRFVRCVFRGCHLTTVTDPEVRAVVRNVEVHNCRVWGESSSISGAVIEDCVIDTFRADGAMLVFGCVYKHVMIRGWLGPTVLDNRLVSIWISDEVKRQFRDANARYYDTVDWALDISEARSNDMGIRGIPSTCIRRDPERQVLISQVLDRAEDWQKLDLDRSVRFWLERQVDNSWQDGIYIVPEKHPRRQSMLDSLAQLRSLGVAE